MIPKELLAALRTIEIHTARLATEQLSGTYTSSFKGQGLAFREVRPYQPGDDVRAIDWNVSARMNETFVKVFVEEREMTVMLLVDLSGSERFGTRRATKVRVASEVAALLAFSAIRNNDRVGLIVATDKIDRIVPPKKGEKHVMRVVREILGFAPTPQGPSRTRGRHVSGSSRVTTPPSFELTTPPSAGVPSDVPSGAWSKPGVHVSGSSRVTTPPSFELTTPPSAGVPSDVPSGAWSKPGVHVPGKMILGAATDLKAGLETLVRVSHRRSIAFVVSDFYDTGYERALALAAAKHDVVPVVLADPRDAALSDVGLASFEDLESGESVIVDTADPHVRNWYEATMKEIVHSRQTMFHKLGLDSVVIETGGSFVRPLRDLFARRARRIRR